MQSIFKRYEKKYLITRKQYAVLQPLLSQHMAPDRYGAYLVQNLYYDTENWDIIRASVERPLYKEKMRLRCYGEINKDSKLFLELKKKYKGIVYKRRIAIPAKALAGNPIRRVVTQDNTQIARELAFYMDANAVSEKIYISYRRIAFAGIADEGLRVTLDSDIRFRLDCLNYACPGDGHTILPQEQMLMEIKAPGAMPLWLAHVLCENGVYPTSYSKFGVCYTNYILKNAVAERAVRISA